MIKLGLSIDDDKIDEEMPELKSDNNTTQETEGTNKMEDVD